MGQPAAWMIANTQGSFLNNGELYIGDTVSARKTGNALSLCNDIFLIHNSCG
jgi:hypothetical protein